MTRIREEEEEVDCRLTLKALRYGSVLHANYTTPASTS